MSNTRRVFISSTSSDLLLYRQAVVNAVLRLEMFPVDMKDFNASSVNALQECYNKVRSSDIFVGLYAYRYGYVPTNDISYITTNGTTEKADGNKSITNYEYEWAVENDLPIYIFVVDESIPWPANDIEDGDGSRKLQDFKKFLGSQYVWARFESPSDLAAKVTASLAEDTRRQKQNSARETTYDGIPNEFQMFIEEKVQHFVGRENIFEAVTKFVEQNKSGYFAVLAYPGSGKSTFLAEYVRRHKDSCAAHFNMRSEGIVEPRQFLLNIQHQVRTRYPSVANLPFPVREEDFNSFLKSMLDTVSRSLQNGEKFVIAVDALDEARSLSSGVNPLYLPRLLPPGIFFLVTYRIEESKEAEHTPSIQLVVDCPIQKFNMEDIQNRTSTTRDIELYIQQMLKRYNLVSWIIKNQLSHEDFATAIIKKSENNFMYVRHILSAINNGFYEKFDFKALPDGLKNFYRQHWIQMGMMGANPPQEKLKIVYVLSVTRQPSSRKLIAKFSGQDELTVQICINDWSQFIRLSFQNNDTKSYSMYHESFKDFLHNIEIVSAAGIDLTELNNEISNLLLGETSPWR